MFHDHQPSAEPARSALSVSDTRALSLSLSFCLPTQPINPSTIQPRSCLPANGGQVRAGQATHIKPTQGNFLTGTSFGGP